jgi:alpha-L-fucosidase 2
MNKKIATLLMALAPLTAFCQQNLKLWYKQPAKVWTEALPLGNGRLGAMVFGGVGHELIQLNEATLWTGGPVRTNVNPQAYDNLLLAREALLKNEDYAQANEYAKKMQGYYSESYLPLGNLTITQQLKDTIPTAYYRDLDISNAIATTRYTIDGVEYTRQIISSAPDQVIAIRFTASEAGKLNFTLGTGNELTYHNVVISNNQILMKGQAPSHLQPSYVNLKDTLALDDKPGCRGMRYELQVKAVNKDGTVSADTTGITVKNATDVTIYLSAATSFNGFDKCPDSEGKDEHKLAAGYLDKALKYNWPELLQHHYNDYHKYFNRWPLTSLRLPMIKTHWYQQTSGYLTILKGLKIPHLKHYISNSAGIC